MRVSATRGGASLAESWSLPDGQFAVAVPLPAQDDSTLAIEALDSAGQVLGAHEVSSHRPVTLTLNRMLDPEAKRPSPALLTPAAADLAARVTRYESTGELPTGARAVLDTVLLLTGAIVSALILRLRTLESRADTGK